LEDGLRRTVTRLKQYLADLPAPEDLTLAFDWPGLSDGGLEYIEVWLKDHEHGTVLIDTGKRLWNADDEQRGNGSMADYNFIGPLTDLYRDYDAFGVTVWHDRKMVASDFFDQISATRGLTANVDGVANLSRERGSKDGKLSIGHRDGEDKAFSLHWDDMITNWVLVEQVDVAISKSNPKVRVLMALRKLDSELGVDAGLIQAELGDMSLSTVRNHLTMLGKEGAVMNMTKGRWRCAPEEDDDPIG
jgi:DNA-binding transcriptional ArsR family regulator